MIQLYRLDCCDYMEDKGRRYADAEELQDMEGLPETLEELIPCGHSHTYSKWEK